MARVTVEDCIDKVEDRFELVALASQRAKQVSSGAPLTVDRNGEKNTVLALREIEEETILVPDLREALTHSFQRERELEELYGEVGADDDSPEGESAGTSSPSSEEIQALEAAAESELSKELKKDSLSFADENLDVDD